MFVPDGSAGANGTESLGGAGGAASSGGSPAAGAGGPGGNTSQAGFGGANGGGGYTFNTSLGAKPGGVAGATGGIGNTGFAIAGNNLITFVAIGTLSGNTSN